MKSLWSKVQKQAFDSANVMFRSSGQSATGDGAGQTADDKDDETLNEALEQALNTRSKGIHNHFAGLSPDAYSETQELRVWASTFNVNGEKPRPDHDYRSWLMHPGDKWPERSDQTASWEGPDILFVGFQEINALNAVTLVAGGGLDTVKAWNTAIDCALNCKPLPREYVAAQEVLDALSNGFTGSAAGTPTAASAAAGGAGGAATPDAAGGSEHGASNLGTAAGAAAAADETAPPLGFGVKEVKVDPRESEQYVNVGGRLLVGLFLTVWVRKPIAPYITAWQDADVRCGKMGFGNKGAVMLRMRVFDEPIAVVCGHLASGETAADALKRKADFMQICRTGYFGGLENNGQTILHAPLEIDHRQGEWRRSQHAARQPTVIFLGDLNFRINLPDAEVRTLLRRGALDRLLARDELVPALSTGDGVFAGWCEGAITFPPTFKFAKGTTRYIGDPVLEDEGSVDKLASALQALTATTGKPGSPLLGTAADRADSSHSAAASAADGASAAEASPADVDTATKAKAVAAHVVMLSDDDADGGEADTDSAAAAERSDAGAPRAGGSQRRSLEDSVRQSAAMELDLGDGGTAGGAFAESAAASTPATPAPRTPTAATSERQGSFAFSRQGSTLMRGGASAGGAGAGGGARERVRTPAWTDRVLFRCNSAGDSRLHQLLYSSADALPLSDHRPVVAAFLLDAVRLDEVRMRREMDAAQRALDALANSTQPRCEVAENLLDVGELRYGEVVERSCTLSCCGEVPAEWRLLSPRTAAADGGAFHTGDLLPPWIQVHPTHGILSPGQSVDMTFRIGVAEVSAQALGDPATAERVVTRYDAPCSLSHLFVVHISNGADHFVAVDGTYMPSFLGLTVTTLAAREKAAVAAAEKAEKAAEAARAVAEEAEGGEGAEGKAAAAAEAEAQALEAAAAARLEQCRCGGEGMSLIGASPFVPAQWFVIPQALKKMLHFLARDESLATAGIFSESFQIIRSEALEEEGAAAAETAGQLSAVHAVQVALDAGKPVPATATAHDVAATMLSYFKALPRPFFPESISTLCSVARPDANKAASALKDALGAGVDWAVLCCVMRLLKLVIKAQAEAAAAAAAAAAAEGAGESPVRTLSSSSDTPRSATQQRQALRQQLAACFADVWFPAISLQDLDEHATADDYAAILQKASDASARQAQFLQMFLV